MSPERQYLSLPLFADLDGLHGAGNGLLHDGLRDDDLDGAVSALDDLDPESADPVVLFEGYIVSDDGRAHKNPQSFKAIGPICRTVFLCIGELSQNKSQWPGNYFKAVTKCLRRRSGHTRTPSRQTAFTHKIAEASGLPSRDCKLVAPTDSATANRLPRRSTQAEAA